MSESSPSHKFSLAERAEGKIIIIPFTVPAHQIDSTVVLSSFIRSVLCLLAFLRVRLPLPLQVFTLSHALFLAFARDEERIEYAIPSQIRDGMGDSSK